MHAFITQFGQWMDALCGVGPRKPGGPFDDIGLYVGIAWLIYWSGFFIWSLAFWQMYSEANTRWLNAIDKIFAVFAIPVILFRRGKFNYREWDPDGNGFHVWGIGLIVLGLFLTDIFYEGTQTETAGLRFLQTFLLLGPIAMGLIFKVTFAVTKAVAIRTAEGAADGAKKARETAEEIKDKADHILDDVGPARWAEWIADKWLDFRIWVRPNALFSGKKTPATFGLKTIRNPDTGLLELNLTPDDDWVLFGVLAKEIKRKLLGQWTTQADVVDQRLWIMKIEGAVLELNMDVYEGITLNVLSDSTDMQAAEGFLEEAAEYLNTLADIRLPYKF
jgi:hypothetical protein